MRKALVVDDNRDMCRIINDILQEENFVVHIENECESALNRVKNTIYDLMILDYKIPEIDGLTVLEKSLQIIPSLTIIMISAFGDDSIKERARHLGVYEFFDKPFDVEQLLITIRKAFNGKRSAITH